MVHIRSRLFGIFSDYLMTPVSQFTVAERKGRIARVQIRQLIREVEKKIIELEKCDRFSTLQVKFTFLLFFS